MLILWIIIFIASLALVVKSADWFVGSAEKIGKALRISPFIIGVVIVAIGTSFPEIATSLIAAFKGTTEIIPANVIGSNIANILLIVGLSAIVARKLIVKRSLIDLDSPLLAATTALFIFVMWDKQITAGEGVLLLIGFVIYLLYTIFQTREDDTETLPARHTRRKPIKKKVFVVLIFSIAGLAVGANYVIESMIKIADIIKISTSVIAITAGAIGTSLPELIVSVQAARKKKYEIALGNVFGSNVFNFLLVCGIPALITPLTVDSVTFAVGLPFLITATLLFVISGISKKIHIWEGLIYIIIYIIFVIRLISFF